MRSDHYKETPYEYRLRSLRSRYIYLRDILHPAKKDYYGVLVKAVMREECRIMIDTIFKEIKDEELRDALKSL